MAFVTELKVAMQEHAARSKDPLRAKVERLMRGTDAMSTIALLDLLGLPNTTANGRLLAKTCRGLGLIPLKSRRLMPGGHAGTVIRGWTRPLRPVGEVKGETVSPSHLKRGATNPCPAGTTPQEYAPCATA